MSEARKVRVAGTDPGTSGLDVLVLEDGTVVDQARFQPSDLQADPSAPLRWLVERGPFDLVAGPSGYGLPLVRGGDCTERDLALMTLVRPDERGPGDERRKGVLGFTSVLRAFLASSLPIVFLPGVIHLPTVPAHRKINRIDLGTPDKLCVAALALALRAHDVARYSACVVELGSAFTACVVLSNGRVVDGAGGTSGPFGWASGGAWDGEMAYLFSPLAKRDLFAGGVGSVADAQAARYLYCESVRKTVAGLRSVTSFSEIVLSGRLGEIEPDFFEMVGEELQGPHGFGSVVDLPSLPGARVKHAAQGAAVVADGLAGGRYAPVVERLELRRAAGTVLDGLAHPRAAEVRAWFSS
jgi:predicted butyrate kinase (DUF1464 family)